MGVDGLIGKITFLFARPSPAVFSSTFIIYAPRILVYYTYLRIRRAPRERQADSTLSTLINFSHGEHPLAALNQNTCEAYASRVFFIYLFFIKQKILNLFKLIKHLIPKPQVNVIKIFTL